MKETALVAALAADVDGTFEALVMRYQDRLYACALHMLGDRQAAEEAAQDAFVRAYRALKTYSRQRIAAMALRPWLYRILLNVVRNRVRRKRVAETPLVHPDGSALELPDFQPARRPDEAMMLSETARVLADAMAALPDRLRAPVTLRHVDGLPYAEIAEILQQPIGTVKVYVHRGVRELRLRLSAGEVS